MGRIVFYHRPMSNEDFRNRLYEAYASSHEGAIDRDVQALMFERDILPHLPRDRQASIVDLGCGQGELVRRLSQAGYTNASGIDISPEQVSLAINAGVPQVVQGDFREVFRDDSFDAITATDFFEHLTRPEVLEAVDCVYASLKPGGSLIMRVPNAVSPFGGVYRYGDLTHETSFTSRSLNQLGSAAGFVQVDCFGCPPVTRGSLTGLARRGAWAIVGRAMRAALSAEIGRGSHIITNNLVAVMTKAR